MKGVLLMAKYVTADTQDDIISRYIDITGDGIDTRIGLLQILGEHGMSNGNPKAITGEGLNLLCGRLLLDSIQQVHGLSDIDIFKIYKKQDYQNHGNFDIDLLRSLRLGPAYLVFDYIRRVKLRTRNQKLREEDLDYIQKQGDLFQQYRLDLDPRLLTFLEERAFSITIQNWPKLEEILKYEDFSSIKSQSAGNNSKLTEMLHLYPYNVERLRNQVHQDKQLLIRHNTRLVINIAKRYLGTGSPFLDLIQDGNLGLMKAIQKYDWTRGYRFSTYATWWVRQNITRALADTGSLIRKPVHVSDRLKKYYRRKGEYTQLTGLVPSLDICADIVVEMGLVKNPEENPDKVIRKVNQLERWSMNPISIHIPIGDDGEELEQFIVDETSPTPFDEVSYGLLQERIESVLGTLSPREARILRLRFGLQDGNKHTLEEVGQKFGLTRERIRQIEGKALGRLRHPRRARKLKDFLY